MEAIAYFSYWASTELAEERGRLRVLQRITVGSGHHAAGHAEPAARGAWRIRRYRHVGIDELEGPARAHQAPRMRNSNCLAIASDRDDRQHHRVSASIEPTFQNLFVKSNLSGEFTIRQRIFVADLKKLALWDEVMVADLKYFDGNLPASIAYRLKFCVRLYATAFEVEPVWVVEAASPAAEWIASPVAQHLHRAGFRQEADESYKAAWQRGLKTTYYLRSMGARRTPRNRPLERQTERCSRRRRDVRRGAPAPRPSGEPEIKFCKIDDCGLRILPVSGRARGGHPFSGGNSVQFAGSNGRFLRRASRPSSAGSKWSSGPAARQAL